MLTEIKNTLYLCGLADISIIDERIIVQKEVVFKYSPLISFCLEKHIH